jgi:hypothetical protein
LEEKGEIEQFKDRENEEDEDTTGSRRDGGVLEVLGMKLLKKCLIDLQRGQVRAVPVHLGLTDRPFMSQNLISAHGSPIPLQKF